MTLLEFVKKHQDQLSVIGGYEYLLKVASNFETGSYLYNLSLLIGFNLFANWKFEAILRDNLSKILDIPNYTEEYHINQIIDDYISDLKAITIFYSSENKSNYCQSKSAEELYKNEMYRKHLCRFNRNMSTIQYAMLIEGFSFIDNKELKLYLYKMKNILDVLRNGDFDLYYKAILTHYKLEQSWENS